MLTSKQRSQLKALATKEDTIVHIGKGGLSDNILKQAEDALKAREIIKCKVLENSILSAKDACSSMAEALNAEAVQVIGTKFVLYKRNEEQPKIVLEK